MRNVRESFQASYGGGKENGHWHENLELVCSKSAEAALGEMRLFPTWAAVRPHPTTTDLESRPHAT